MRYGILIALLALMAASSRTLAIQECTNKDGKMVCKEVKATKDAKPLDLKKPPAPGFYPTQGDLEPLDIYEVIISPVPGSKRYARVSGKIKNRSSYQTLKAIQVKVLSYNGEELIDTAYADVTTSDLAPGASADFIASFVPIYATHKVYANSR